MVTGDGSYIKQINRSLILQKIIEHGMISRADVAKVVGLNKATISVQVADLLAEELIYETHQEHHNLGRRPIMLSLNRKSGYALGIDLDYKSITYTLSDLLGTPVNSEIIPINTSDYKAVLEMLKNQIKKFQAMSSDSRYGLIGVVIGVHGTVSKDEKVFFVPQHQWHDKDLKLDLEKELEVEVQIVNNANASAFAEKVFHYHNSENLLSITMHSGMGLGIIMENELLKGYNGYAGEIGHMIIFPKDKLCKCGNKGCWELYASESSFLNELAILKNKESLSYDEVQKMIDSKDPLISEPINRLYENLAIGLNNIINMYNPETIVLNSKILKMQTDAIDQIRNHLHSSVTQYSELEISELGIEACAMGACAIAIKNFLKVPDLRLEFNPQTLASSQI